MKRPEIRRRVFLAAAALVLAAGALAAQQTVSTSVARWAHPGVADDEIAPGELKRLLDGGEPVTLLDVREPWEWEIARLPGARLTPITHIEDFIGSLDPDDRIVLYCKQGGRSMRAIERLRAAGFKHLRSLAGGIDRWEAEVDPSLPRY
jgi:adenylyltransferase/sulfurtransferase